jgi:hypothetical protein
MLAKRWGPLVTLAMTPVGIEVEIKQIRFDLVRARCASLDLEEGMIVMTIGTSLAFVEVERPDGEVVHIEREYASFIAVEEPERTSVRSTSGGALPSRITAAYVPPTGTSR